MLSLDVQQRVREALHQVDVAAGQEVAFENTLREKAETFRDNLFNSFQYIEQESMQLQELLVKVQRADRNQLQVLPKGRAHFTLVLDGEFAYDSRPPAQGEASAAATHELAARLFAVLLPPLQGLLRYYTIFHDGCWKRTSFVPTPNGAQPRSTMVPRATPDVVILEAIDLLGYACTVHPAWAAVAPHVDTITPEWLRSRGNTKAHMIPGGAARSGGPGQ